MCCGKKSLTFLEVRLELNFRRRKKQREKSSLVIMFE